MLQISGIEIASPEQWDYFYRTCNYATYFHSPWWAQTWVEYSEGRWVPEPLHVTFSDGREAVIVLSRSGNGSDASHASSHAGTFGGWLAEQPLTPDHGRLMQDLLLTKTHLVWRRNPYDPMAGLLDPAPREEQDQTISIDLRVGKEEILRRWHTRMLPDVRKARRCNLATKEAATLEDWESYFVLYEMSLARWGDRASSRYDWGLFEALRKKPQVRLWLVSNDVTPVGGALVLYAQRHIVYWHGAADAGWFSHCPINLLMHDIILDAVRRGYWWFDFNPSGGHKGAKQFKLRCGGVPMSSPVVLT